MITNNESMLLNIIDSISRGRSDEIKRSKYKDFEFNKSGSYPYIPIAGRIFFESILAVKNAINLITPFDISTLIKNKPTFVDYGAGTGIPMRIAEYLGFRSNGIEIDDECIKNAVWYSNKGNAFYLEKADLIDFNTFVGRLYDVVYYYCPFLNPDKELEFELNAIKTVKVGGYIIAPYPGLLATYHLNHRSRYNYGLNYENKIVFYNQMKNFEHIQDFIFKRIK